MSQKKFGPGDKIFAKVRGYPPWPARVEGLADETPNKMKYHVFFYGTAETAICKAEELFPYVEFRDKYGKPLKKRGFNEAVEQVDAELGLTPGRNQVEASTEDSDPEDSLVIDETPGGTTKKSLIKSQKSTPQTTPVTKKDSKTAKRKLDDSNASEDKGPGSSKKAISSEESVATKPPEVTRSGRKVKPKRFADHNDELENESEESESTTNVTPKNNSVKIQKKASSNNADKSSTSEDVADDTSDRMETEGSVGNESDAEFLKTGVLVAFTPAGQEFKLKLDLGLNRPTFKSEKSKQQWEARVIRDGRRLRSQIESGERIPESVKREIEQKYNARLIQLNPNKANMMLDDRREKLTYLKIEAQLLDIDCRIKCSLTLKQADPETCLRTLDELLELKLSPLMVKKHPHVVETVKKLRKYVGNTATWEMSDEDADIFASKAGMIRAKAEHVYNKIKSMFLVPYGKSFWDVFSVALSDFQKKTDHLPMEELFAMTVDPSEIFDIFASDKSTEEPKE